MPKASNQFFVPHNVWEEDRFLSMPDSAKTLHTVLCKLKNRLEQKDGWFYRSIKDLMNDTHLSERTVKRAKKLLFKLKYIDIKRGKEAHFTDRSPDYFRLNGYKFKLDAKG